MSSETIILADASGSPAQRKEMPDRETGILTLALLPPVAMALVGSGFWIQLVAALGVAWFWSFLFARLRRRAVNLSAIPAAMVFALLVPLETPLWQAMIALSFGAVIGNEIFGGRGYSFLHPAAAALAFLFLSWPVADGTAISEWVAIAALPGILMLFLLGVLPVRTAVVVLVVLLLFMPQREALPILLLGLAFLICDPASGGSTHGGRYLHGLLAAVLVVAPMAENAAASLALAAFVASLFAPLFDIAARHARNVLEEMRRG